MKTTFLFTLLMNLVFAGGLALAANGQDGELERLARADQINLEARIKAVLEAESESTNLNEFYVEWEGLRCLSAPPSEFEPKPLGACVVQAGAFQVHAQMTVLFTQGGTEVRALSVDIE